MNRNVKPVLLFVLSTLFFLTACTKTEGGVRTIEGPGIYKTKEGYTAYVLSANSYPIESLEYIPIFGSKCRSFSQDDEGYGSVNLYLCP